MRALELLRGLGPLLLALIAALAVDRLSERRGLVPPRFRVDPAAGPAGLNLPLLRRSIALSALALVLWVGVFGPLAAVGSGVEPDYSRVSAPELFLLHLLLAATVATWYLLGFGWPGRQPYGPAGRWTAQLGLRTPRLGVELGVGLAAGVVSWLAVIAVMVGLGALAWQLGGERFLPREPPAMLPWIAGLPILVRLAVSISAGVVEELFFRGFLQPRVGIGLSSGLFVLAHMSYEQPVMLIGVALLSLVFAGLVEWRQSIWAAIVAHFVFDAVQLLIIIPTALKYLPGAEGGAPSGLAWGG